MPGTVHRPLELAEVAISFRLHIPYAADASSGLEDFTQAAEHTRTVRFEGGDS